MASIAQLVSEIAHSVGQPDSVPVRNAIKFGIIHARNELIRKTYSNHNYTDKVLQQRVRLSLKDVPEGDLYGSEDLGLCIIKRTVNKVPKPVRLTNNLPFHSVHTCGVKNAKVIPFIKECSSKFYSSLPGFCLNISYDYNNGYIYINIPKNNAFNNINSIIVESVFEYPHLIEEETIDGKVNLNTINDRDEFLIPEDMIGDLKKIILSTWNEQIIRDTNVIPSQNVVQ